MFADVMYFTAVYMQTISFLDLICNETLRKCSPLCLEKTKTKQKNSFYVTLGKQLVNIHMQKNRPSNMKDVYFKSPTS